MDGIKLLKELKRMCTWYRCVHTCSECPLFEVGCNFPGLSPEKVVIIVEQWSKEHPVKTNAVKFEEVFRFGHTLIDKRDSWWDEPYEEPKEDE